MPAVRSFFTLSVLAACLAQVMADGYGSGDGGYGGGGKGSWGGDKGATGWGEWSSAPYTSAWPVESPTTNVGAQNCPPPVTTTETTTVTAVSPCTESPVTAYVTQWMNAPPGCWCGAGGPPGGWDMGGSWNDSPAWTPGLSSIPASEALQTGVTVAAAAAAPPPTGGAGYYGASSWSSAVSTSGTETSGPLSVPSNKAEPTTKAGEAPKPEASTSTSSSSSSSSAATSTTSTLTATKTSSTSTTTSPATSPSPPASAEAESDSVSSSNGGFPTGSFVTYDPSTLTLKNAYTLGIGKRAPLPTLLSP